MDIIKNYIYKYLGKKYTNDYIKILIEMLNVDEKLRPDFVQLNSMMYSFFDGI